MKSKLTLLEKQWILYDVGNSAFTLLVTTIVPIYFNALATNAGISQENYLAYWGYAGSISTLLVALSGPIIGTASDAKGRKKTLFVMSIIIGALGCLVMGLMQQWMIFLVIFIIAKVGYQISLIIYDSMLGDITTEEHMDTVSSQGYAWGYIGSVIPFVMCLLLVLTTDYTGIPMSIAMLISFIIVAIWWVVCSLPLIKSYRQKNYVEPGSHAFKNTFSRLWQTLKSMKEHKKILYFLLAFFFYIDGVYTIIDMATAYGSSLGLGSSSLLLALLVTQIVAFPSAILIGRLARSIPAEKIITICIAAYTGIAIYAAFMVTQFQFWTLAIAVGLFQGGIQALSRSYFAKIIPAEKSGEYFGILDIVGKGASFLGTTVIGVVTQVTSNQHIGVGAIAVFFVVGFFLFRKSVAQESDF